MKRKICVIIVLLFLLILELRPYEIHHSTVVTTGNTTEVELCVIANTFLPYNKEKFARDVIKEYKALNGERENTIYTIEIYRFIVN